MLTLIFADPVRPVTPDNVEQYTRCVLSVTEIEIRGKARYNSFEKQGYHYTTMIVENGDPTYQDIVFVMIGGTPEIGTCLNVLQYPEVARFYNELLDEIRVMTDGVLGDFQFMHVMDDGRRVGTYSIVMRKNPFTQVMAEEQRKLFKLV